MKILVIGSWQKEKALQSEKEAKEIGKLLAFGGHTLVSGGGNWRV